jgi:LmbE family N-acetylglucosaminyl deacetylase
MSERKQTLLKAHRRHKRMAVLALTACAVLLGAVVGPWATLVFVMLAWVAHEAWFADHLFYQPGDDYHYAFPPEVQPIAVALANGQLIGLPDMLPIGETLILEVTLRTSLVGRFLDPFVSIGDDRQDFERGARGVRYLNLSGQREQLLAGGLRIQGQRCELSSSGRLFVMDNPDFTQQRMMIIAPHADDAELAAFGQYQRAADVSIVTLTQGEIEAQAYEALGLAPAQAARLKGRLRTWDSLAAPLWGGVTQANCVQLGYFCMQLPAMRAEPDMPFGSKVSGDLDIRPARRHNPVPLPADLTGEPTWRHLVADLVALLEHRRPQVLVMPHPELDPHADHVASTQAVFEAIAISQWKPDFALYYANHLHDNDRWPMGPANQGVALPPAIEPLAPYAVWSPVLSAEVQLDKAMALRLQHDLQTPLPLKRRLRRSLQRVLAARQWPRTGEDEFFRKAVRLHEVFFVHPL